MGQAKAIVLATLNARFTHTSLGLRYLYANLAEWQDEAVVLEFVINDPIQEMAEKILAFSPKIVGLGVYIWNAQDIHWLAETIKKVSPDTVVVLGGPEVSYEPFRINVRSADYIIQGEGERAFLELCRQVLTGIPPQTRIVPPVPADLSQITLPYDFYTDEDLAHRYLYVEASRGCPYLCEFCLSSLDKKVRYFDPDLFLDALERLWQRGARRFKFVDRTFNLDIALASRLMDFFLTKEPPYFVHFEMIPDHFPEVLKERLTRFPAGSLQLEIGIQTLDSEVAARIRRPLNIPKIQENLRFLQEHTHAHLHLDLIVGLPGESAEGFGRSLDLLATLTEGEIQVGILKKLSGTTLSRHDIEYGMVYTDRPPYDLLKSATIDFETMQEMKRFARFWEIFYNSGNFERTIRLLWPEGRVFEGFWAFGRYIYAVTASTWKFALERAAGVLYSFLLERGLEAGVIIAAMREDMQSWDQRKIPRFVKEFKG